jgi:hypothetical protein
VAMSGIRREPSGKYAPTDEVRDADAREVTA